MPKFIIGFFIFSVTLAHFQACAGRPEVKPPELDDIISRFDKQFDEEIGNTIPGAVILFIKDGEIYYKNAFG